MVRLVALSQHRLHSGGGAPARALYSHCRAHTRRRRESERQPMTRLVPGLDLDPCGQRDCAHGRSKRAAVVGAAASRGERFITLPFASVTKIALQTMGCVGRHGLLGRTTALTARSTERVSTSGRAVRSFL